MEGSVRSDGVVKKKSSSGCLIIKKKGQGGNGVVVGDSSKEKKRPRMILSDSGSSDEMVEAMGRKSGEKIHNGGVGFRGHSGSGDGREFGSKGEFLSRDKSRMKSDFDKYDDFGGREVRNEYWNADDKLKMGRRVPEGSRGFGESGSLRNSVVQNRKHSCMEGSNSVGSWRSKGIESGDCMSKLELDEAEAQLPISLLSLKYQDMPDKPIRLQGKNGVLKVMVNSKKKPDSCSYDDRGHIENRKGNRFEVVKKDLNMRPPLYSESKHMKKRMTTDISEENLSMSRQKLLGKRSIDDDLDLDKTDTSLKLAPPSLHASSSSKMKKEERSSTENCISARKKGKHVSSIESITPVSGEEGKRISTGNSTPAKGNEGKIKGGGSTEKQKLRETIREMLIESGWTIDYRPRRNRDYLDAVYISPSGTAYWSIIKAYEALQKQFNGQQSRSKSAGLPSSFAPLSEDLISKLTRQTRKKIEEKMKKRREDGLSKNNKKAVNESGDATSSDQPEETSYSWLKNNLKLSKDKKQKLHHESGDESSDDTHKQKMEGDRVEKSLDASKNRMEQGIKSTVMGRCILRVRDSKAQNSESDGYVPYTGKRTVLAWLVDSGIVKLGEKVQYMNRKLTRVQLEGWITNEGINCGCCSKVLTVAKFELHAGSKLRRPFQNIFLESGVSLLQCQIDAWNRQKESERQDFYTVNVDGDDPEDDACGTCGDGGDLICCDSCPSTFHQSCLEIKMLPEGDWNCPNCVCKFCGNGSPNGSGDKLSGDELTICSLCERKYHKSCCTDNAAPANSNSGGAYFCDQKCQELFDHLHNILGVKHDLEAGFSWSLIQRTNIHSDKETIGLARRVECNSKLAVALSVMNECFLPIADRRSGINLIHNVFYNCGANFQRLNFHGFFTAVLERGDEIISVASIRLHGTQLAEMPFIGTRHIYRRQGMCRRLLSAVELALSSLKVEKLIIPAISEHMHTWTVVFGFNPLEKEIKKEIKSMNMLVFPGTDMLQKQLMKTTTDGITAISLTASQRQLTALVRKSSSTSSGEDEDEDEDSDAKVLLNVKEEKFNVESGSADLAACPPIITSSPAPSSSDSISKSGIRLSLAETGSDQAKPLVESTSTTKSLFSLSALRTGITDLKPVDPLNKDHIQSPTRTETDDQPAGIVESSGKETSSIAKNIKDAVTDMGGNTCVNSTVASDEVNIQSTLYEVTTKDHDMTDSALDNLQTRKSTDGISSASLLDMNKPGVGVKDDLVSVSNSEVATDAEGPGHTYTSSVYEVGNRDGNGVEAISLEHAPAPVDLNPSGETSGGDFFPSACGETIKSEFCVKMSEMESELHEASGLDCKKDALTTSNISSKCELDRKSYSPQAIPNSINVCLPHGTGKVHTNQESIPEPHSTTSLDSVSNHPGILGADSDPTASRAISSEVTGSTEPTVQSNGKITEVSNQQGNPGPDSDPTDSRAISSEVSGPIEPNSQSNGKSNEVAPIGLTALSYEQR